MMQCTTSFGAAGDGGHGGEKARTAQIMCDSGDNPAEYYYSIRRQRERRRLRRKSIASLPPVYLIVCRKVHHLFFMFFPFHSCQVLVLRKIGIGINTKDFGKLSVGQT